MTGNFIGGFRHRDAVTKVCEPVPDEWTASNREPASDSEICRMSSEQYREWRRTSIMGRANGDRMVIQATGHARKFTRNGIRRLA
jgi:hypothetical protein